MIPTDLQLLFTVPGYAPSQQEEAQAAANQSSAALYTWKSNDGSNRLEAGLLPGPDTLVHVLLPTALPQLIPLPNDLDPSTFPAPRPACTCPDWDRTLHATEIYCPSFGGVSAHCAVCLGCKACTVLQVCGRFRPSPERAQDALNGKPVTPAPAWTATATNPTLHVAFKLDSATLLLCAIHEAGPKDWTAWATMSAFPPAPDSHPQTIHLGHHPHLARAKDHVADWLDSFAGTQCGTAQGSSIPNATPRGDPPHPTPEHSGGVT